MSLTAASKQKSYKCPWQKPIGFGRSLTVWHCLNPRRSRFVIFMQFFGLWREMENVQKGGPDRRNCDGTIPFDLRRLRLFFLAWDSYFQWSGNILNLKASTLEIHVSQFRQVPFFNCRRAQSVCSVKSWATRDPDIHIPSEIICCLES